MANTFLTTNNLQSADLRKKILSLAEVHDEEQVASICNMDLNQVRQIIEEQPSGGWWVRCNKSGKSLTARTKRGAYRLICLQGFTDWDWGKGTIIGEGVQP